MIPPALPHPSNISVFSIRQTSAPAFLAAIAAAVPAHPPPMIITLILRIILFLLVLYNDE
jgi:hypothetical protein